MGLENAALIKDLVSTNPAPGDNKSEGDDHLRMIKRTLKAQFPNLEGPVVQTAAKLNGDYYPRNSSYYQAMGPGASGTPSFEWHRPGFSAYLAFIAPQDNRWYLSQSNGGGNASGANLNFGADGVLNVPHVTVAGTINTTGLRVLGNVIAMPQAGYGERWIHRTGQLIGFLNSGFSWAFWSHDNGDIWAGGNISAFSDERTKRDWVQADPQVLERFRDVALVGMYTDKVSGERRLGVGAQSFRKVLPAAVTECDDLLGVNYGAASLVLIHELTRRLLALEEEVRTLRSKP